MREARFIQANAKLLTVPLVPEIRLYLAEESMPIWQKTEEELGQMNVPPPYWAFAWAGGQALARYLLDNVALVAGRRVLDLGAGSGLASIAAMKSGAASVLAADIDRYALVAVALNAQANDVAVETTDANLLAPLPGRSALCWSGTCSTSGRSPSGSWHLSGRRAQTGRRSWWVIRAAAISPGSGFSRCRIFGARDTRSGGHGDQANSGMAACVRPEEERAHEPRQSQLLAGADCRHRQLSCSAPSGTAA